MAWEEPLLDSSSSAIRWSRFSLPTAAKAASMDVDCAYAPRRCAQAFLTTGDLSCKWRDASRNAFRKVFSPAPADVTCLDDAQAVNAFSAASLTAGEVESRQQVAPSVRSMCVAGPLASFGQQDANARPDAWQAAALHEGSGSSVRAFLRSVSWRSIAEVETSLDLRGTDGRRALMIGRRFKRVGVGDGKARPEHLEGPPPALVVRCGNMAPQQRRVDALDASSLNFAARH